MSDGNNYQQNASLSENMQIQAVTPPSFNYILSNESKNLLINICICTKDFEGIRIRPPACPIWKLDVNCPLAYTAKETPRGIVFPRLL